MIVDRVTGEEIVLCKKHVDFYLKARAHMPPAAASSSSTQPDERAKLQDAERNMSKGQDELRFIQQGAQHTVGPSRASFRWITGLNKAEWEKAFDRTMIGTLPKPTHRIAYVLREDNSMTYEKV